MLIRCGRWTERFSACGLTIIEFGVFSRDPDEGLQWTKTLYPMQHRLAAVDAAVSGPAFPGPDTVTVGDDSWTLPCCATCALVVGDRVVVLYDPGRFGPGNLAAFRLDGRQLWTADGPEYHAIAFGTHLAAWSAGREKAFSIDIDTGESTECPMVK
jgi:hypothetical protein